MSLSTQSLAGDSHRNAQRSLLSGHHKRTGHKWPSAFEPVPSLLEPSTSHASSYPCKRHGSNPSLGSFSTHEDDFEYLVASSLYGDGGRGGDQLSQYSLEGAVLHDFITERRAKHLAKWTSTFCGAFRINPGVITEQIPQAHMFRRIRQFEFLMWSDVSPQPGFRYIRDVIAKAIDVDMGEFSLQLQDESVRRKHVPQAEKYRCGWYLADIHLCFAACLGVGENPSLDCSSIPPLLINC